MNKKHGLLFGIAVIAIAAIFTLTGCPTESDPEPSVTDPALTGTVSITGFAKVGGTLTADTNSLDGSGDITYVWKRGDSATTVNTVISGAAAATYTPEATDQDKYLTVTVSRAGYTGSITSAATAKVADADAVAPTVETVTVTPATATVAPGGTQQFEVNVTGTGDPSQEVTWSITTTGKHEQTTISETGLLTVDSGETQSTLTVRATSTLDTTKFGEATVTVSAAGTSDFTGTLKIQKGNPLADATTANTGEQLTATYTGSEPGPFTYQWKKDNANVATGGTSQTYTPTATGSYTVTISKEGYSPKESSAVTVELGLSFQKGEIGNSLMPFSVSALTFLPVIDGGEFWAFCEASKNSSSKGTDFTANSRGTILANPTAAAVTPDGTIYAVSSNGTVKYLLSSDARTADWTENSPTAIFSSRAIKGIIYGGDSSKEKVIIVGYEGRLAYLTGSSWTQDTGINTGVLDPYEDINGIAYGGGKFVAVNAGGEIAYSSGGDITSATWTKVTDSPFSSIINGIAYGGGTFVAVGNAGKIAYSSDGETWTAASTPNQRNIKGITYGNGMFVAVGEGKTVLYSTDGITWKQAVLPADGAAHNTNFSKVAYGEGTFNGADFRRFVVTGIIASTSGLIYADVE